MILGLVNKGPVIKWSFSGDSRLVSPLNQFYFDLATIVLQVKHHFDGVNVNFSFELLILSSYTLSNSSFLATVKWFFQSPISPV